MAIGIRNNAIGTINCLDYNTIVDDYNGVVSENQDGSVSVFLPNNNGGETPLILSRVCCEYIKPNYIFDIETQTCRWREDVSACTLSNVIKLVLNPKGNDGTLFYVEPNDTCFLTIDFDYLFKIKCETLSDILNTNVLSPEELEIASQITSLENQINEQTVICQSLTNQISILSSDYINTPYSVICENIPDGSNFENPVTEGQYYCLTEPNGLTQWQSILGDMNYYAFTQGDINSFTCDEVQALFEQNLIIINNNIFNGTQTPVLMVECETRFGTKSDLLEEISSLTQQQQQCEKIIVSLNSQLTSLTPITGNLSCLTPIDVFESFDVSLTLDVVTSANTLQTIIEIPLFPAIGVGNLYQYLIGTPNSGFYVCGDSPDGCIPLTFNLSGLTLPNTSSCDSIMNNILDGLFVESGLSGTTGGSDIFTSLLPTSSLASQWLHFTTAITDTTLLSLIANEKIKISLKINNTCGDFCVLLDEIVLDKVCTHVERNDIFLTKSPGFELERIRDNKKSWINNTSPTNRPFVISNNLGGNSIRQTNYDVNDERLVINSKEIDLDISLASAIETDVWCYIVDNPCLLTGITTCIPCAGEILTCGYKEFMDGECYEFMDGEPYDFMDGMFTGSTGTTGTTGLNNSLCCGDNKIDFASLMTQPLSAVTTIEDFEYFLTSELIDAKNRQTLSGYPTLRALYDRYMNSGLYCGSQSSRFDYITMDQFANLVGNYWVDIVEQVIPATTIWGSVKIYSNTIFDQQKFKYRAYSSLFCGNPFSGQTVPSPINGTSGMCTGVSVSTTTLILVSGDNLKRMNPVTTNCDTICLAQMNSGSEFIGTVSVVGTSPSLCEPNDNVISEGMTVEVILSYPNASLNVINGTSPLTYLWSNGATGATTTMSSGDYNVMVTDVNCNEVFVEFTMPVPQMSACWYNMNESPSYIIESVVCDNFFSTAITLSVSSMVVNGVELITTSGYSTTLTSGSTNFIPASNSILSGCTFGNPTGVTYTDFVDLLNTTFVSLGLYDYTAQVSLVSIVVSDSNSEAGFYIIRPASDIFSINTNSDDGVQLKYTNNDITDWDGNPIQYYEPLCENITLVDGVVIE